RELLDQPCVAVYEYDVNWLFPELANFRQLARAEAVMIRDALERNQPREAAERAAAQLRFAEQIRNEGMLIHHLVGSAIMKIALSPLREHLSEINDPVALQTILDMARRYERERNPISEAMQSEYYFGLSIYRDLRAGRYKLSDIAFGQGRFSGNFEELLYNWGLGVPLMLGASRREYEQIWAAKRAELAKPFWERKAPAVQPRRYINQILDPTWERPIHGEAAEVAIVRLLGCAAAIKLHKQRTGDYPASLDALNLGDMMIDPFTGKPFVYRRDPKKGFLLYSVGVNQIDDGGRAAFSETEGGDIAPVQPPPAQRPRGRGVLSAPLWAR
ncbi:MAG: hypothetical protein NZM28_10990, partial [Fimbriimonadales bacterium]|nr:hypothetical protein [Fimbriimonadales bacterium]